MENEIRILLVEDEEHLVEVIQLNLELEGYKVKVANDGKQALKLFKEQRFNLVILDIMLPYIDGIQVCETIRLTDAQIPILMLSAKHTGQERIAGLKAGADDYLVKPFNLEELLLRVQILVKRSVVSTGNIGLSEYSFGENWVNFGTFEFKGINGQQGILSNREVKLLKLLIEKKNEVVSRDLILEMIWGVDVYPSTRTIDNYLLNFRKYFEENPKAPRYFHSVRGVGYKFAE
ncbi:MAG: response regulator transcription factor [Flavobacteriales bacterium]